MKNEKQFSQMNQFSHMLILITYTILSLALIGESFLMNWAKWPLILVAMAIVLCWVLHVRQIFGDLQRFWIYSVIMMVTFFIYGINPVATYDIAILTLIVMIIFTTAGDRRLIWMAMGTYYVTMAYDIVQMILSAKTTWDALLVTRTALHIAMVLLAGFLSQVIIKQWAGLFHHSDKQIEELNEATKRMNVFMANLSHELRTPINAVQSVSGLLLENETDPDRRRDLQEILAAGHRVEVQTDDILDYAELEMGQLVVNTGPCMLSSVLNDLTVGIRHIVPPSIELVIDVSPDVPSVLVTDSDKIRKILYHLISNGLRYTKEGGVNVRISPVRQEYGINLFLEVEDTGIGMSDEEAEKIYSQFYQSRTGREVRSGGLGIGMAIVNGLVRCMGGFMTMKTQIGAGTRFTVSLPMAVADERPCMELKQTDGLAFGAFLNLGRFREPRVREYYSAMLKNLVRGVGLPIHSVSNVEDLKKLAESLEITHLVVGPEEYTEHAALIEEYAKNMIVAVVAAENFRMPADTNCLFMPKPVYCFPVVEVMKTRRAAEVRENVRLRCPGVRALVVDDEPMNLRVASEILKNYRMEVTTANSGQQAVDLCEQETFDIIFMDHMMPQMDGVEAMKLIRTGEGRQSHVPIVMLTANTLSTSKAMFARAGADGFVGKPIKIAELERVLKTVLPASAVEYESASGSERPAQGEPARDVFGDLEKLGLNLSEGLGFCQNDRDFYLELLRQYVTESAGKRSEMTKFLDAGDLPGYAIVVHALKSTSKMIGADRLSEKARALEEASKAGNREEVDRLHDEMAGEYADLTQKIGELLGVETDTGGEDDEILEFGPEGGDEA